MFVRVTGRGVTVEEPDDCASLSVRLVGVPADRLDEVLGGARLGRAVGAGHTELDVERLRELASAGPTGPDWPHRWTSMLAYAAGQGWLSADGTTVRAHVEPGQPPPRHPRVAHACPVGSPAPSRDSSR